MEPGEGRREGNDMGMKDLMKRLTCQQSLMGQVHFILSHLSWMPRAVTPNQQVLC